MANGNTITVTGTAWVLVELNPSGNTGNVQMVLTPNTTGEWEWNYSQTDNSNTATGSMGIGDVHDIDVYVRHRTASADNPQVLSINRR